MFIYFYIIDTTSYKLCANRQNEVYCHMRYFTFTHLQVCFKLYLIYFSSNIFKRVIPKNTK